MNKYATVNDLIAHLQALPDDTKKLPYVTRSAWGTFGLTPRDSLGDYVTTDPEWEDPANTNFTGSVVQIY